MLGLNTLFIADSRQVEMAVPFQELILKQLESGNLFTAELQPQEMTRVLRKSFHLPDYNLKGNA